MECLEVLERLWEYLDHELVPEEAEAVGAHLTHCEGCYPTYCCHRALLELLARQGAGCPAPSSLVVRVQSSRPSSPRP